MKLIASLLGVTLAVGIGAGVIGTTVLNAQQQLFPSELNLAQQRALLFTSYANLYKAMGGGWVTAADRLTVPAGCQPPGTPTGQGPR